jgi:hypothetical protein
MKKTKIIEPTKFIPFINKKILFRVSWGLKKDNEEDLVKFEEKFIYIRNMVINSDIKGYVYYDFFDIEKKDNNVIFKNKGIEWSFPTVNGMNIGKMINNKLALQIVTLGENTVKHYENLESSEAYSDAFYFHGFSVWMAEALAQYSHNTIINELGKRINSSRFSFGYDLCPNMEMQKDLFSLLEMNSSDQVILSEGYMMSPEQSTSALIIV